MSLKQNQKSIVNDAIIKEIIEAVNNLKYGYIQITAHNSTVNFTVLNMSLRGLKGRSNLQE